MTTLTIILSLSAGTALAGDFTPTAEERAVYDAFLSRDASPTCAEVEALTETPAETLQVIVREAAQPPWVAIRAADCLIRNHSVAVEDELKAWVTDPDLLGLALLALGTLDEMEPAVALSVADAAIKGPLKEQAGERILKSESEQIRAIAELPEAVAPTE